MKISKVVIGINRSKQHAEQTAKALKAVLDSERVQQEWVETLPPQRNPWIIDHRHTRHVEVTGLQGESMPWPPTNMVLVAEKPQS